MCKIEKHMSESSECHYYKCAHNYIENSKTNSEGCYYCKEELAFSSNPCDYCGSTTIGCDCGQYEAWKNKVLKVDYEEANYCSNCGRKLVRTIKETAQYNLDN
jgi:hypothetical protein